MYAVILLLEPESGGQIQQIANTFGVDWPHLMAQIISFSIVCILLHRFAYKPVLKMLEQRRQQIAQCRVAAKSDTHGLPPRSLQKKLGGREKPPSSTVLATSWAASPART